MEILDFDRISNVHEEYHNLYEVFCGDPEFKDYINISIYDALLTEIAKLNKNLEEQTRELNKIKRELEKL